MTGCYGKFSLTRKLYEWNGTFENKFLITILMWALMVIPVYALASFADLFVLNLIEFWTGTNPVASLTHGDGSTTQFARQAPDTVRVIRTVNGVQLPAFEIVLTGPLAVQVRSVEGAPLASAEGLAGGGIALTSAEGARQLTSEQVLHVERASNRATAAAQVLGLRLEPIACR